MPSKVDTRTAKARNRAARQEALREQFAANGHHTQALKIIEKIQDVSGEKDPKNAAIEGNELKRLEIALKGHLDFCKKYVPDMKAVEVSQDPENPVMTEDQIDARLARLIEALGKAKG